MEPLDPRISFIVNAKQSYRTVAREQSWVQKIESIQRMREAALKAREAMAQRTATSDADSNVSGSPRRRA